MNFRTYEYKSCQAVSVSDPHCGFSFGPLQPLLACEQAEGSHRGPEDPEGAY